MRRWKSCSCDNGTQGAPVNDPDCIGQTPLFYAVTHCQVGLLSAAMIFWTTPPSQFNVTTKLRRQCCNHIQNSSIKVLLNLDRILLIQGNMFSSESNLWPKSKFLLRFLSLLLGPSYALTQHLFFSKSSENADNHRSTTRSESLSQIVDGRISQIQFL